MTRAMHPGAISKIVMPGDGLLRRFERESASGNAQWWIHEWTMSKALSVSQELMWNLMLKCKTCGHQSPAELARPRVQRLTVAAYTNRQSCLKHPCKGSLMAFIPEVPHSSNLNDV